MVGVEKVSSVTSINSLHSQVVLVMIKARNHDMCMLSNIKELPSDVAVYGDFY